MVETWTGSYTKLVLFEKCPRAYFYKYIQGLEYSTPALELGKMVHDGIAKFLTTGEYNNEIARFITPKVKRLQGKVEAEFIERDVELLVNDVFMGLDVADIVAITGKIDVYDPASATVIDWKTSWTKKNEDKRQLLLYVQALKEEGIDVKSAVFHYLRFNDDVKVKLDKKEMEQTVDWGKSMIEAIAEANFIAETEENIDIAYPKTENPATCLSCPYKQLCNGVQTTEDVVELAKEIEKLESLLELKKEMLRSYIEEFGEVKTDIGVWKFTEVNNWDFDVKKVFNYIKEQLKKDPFQYLNCTLTSLKKLKLPEQELEKLGTKKVTYKLTEVGLTEVKKDEAS